MVLAHVERLRFGKEVAYTYGPLGFLVTPLAISPSSLAAAICYAALGGFSLACATIVACSRRFGSTIGVVAASVLMVTAPLEIFAPELYSLGLILLACLVAQRELHLPRVPFIAVIGVGAALQTLIKPTAGALAVVALVVAIVSTSGPRMRGLGAGAAGYLVGILRPLAHRGPKTRGHFRLGSTHPRVLRRICGRNDGRGGRAVTSNTLPSPY